MRISLAIQVAVLLFSVNANSQVVFSDLSQQAGLNITGLNYGAAAGDYDNDGLEDLFATRLLLGSVLFRNLGDNQFEDITAEAGILPAPTAQFAIWGDIDNDGWLDLFIGARDDANALYRNNQDGTFTNIAASAGVLTGTKVKSALFADIDRDGWLDIYIARLGLENVMYRNNGNGTFTDITFFSGATDPLISMGAVFFDYDNDGDSDLYLTHDANIPNILYQNNGNGQFLNVSQFSGANIAAMGMGVDVGDINNDGWLDLYITNLGPNTLLLNNGNGTFSNLTFSSGLGDPGMGWGCSFMDYDNDGFQDIYMANDSYFTPFPNLLYRNLGNNTFDVVSQNSPVHSMEGGYGIACADFDQDGWIDIYLANYGGTVGNQFFNNQNYSDNNWIRIKLKGVQSNRAAIGTRVRVSAGDLNQVDEVSGGSGWASQNSLILHFGLGSHQNIDLLTVHWPSGIIDTFENVNVNELLTIEEGESKINDPTSSREVVNRRNFDLSLSPIPATDGVKIRASWPTRLSGLLQYTVYDVHGRPVLTARHPIQDADAFSTMLNTEGLNDGLYWLRVNLGNQHALERFVLHR